MANWKDFKNWLERKIVISDGLKVKIKLEKQTIYGGTREGKIEALEKQLKNKNKEVKWLQEQLKTGLGIEKYHLQIVVNYPPQ
ncbi:protein of unknown function [endosymbiont DhMRE of Dentiscutata heterogama]|uniref:hypothetical protein n=1 Tax=endosymbiont DhMRE of Dentiscutata heterogama TaxID=1609546 RepID=UPI000629D785|nr:hypothetical protein [endosymbiont DhMRE of Dentiscutata heterogama]CFW93130.1 protein of unknown function [endosymbiont DhMRE of Dentiscutata heterogama]